MALENNAEVELYTLHSLVCKAADKYPNRIGVTYDDGISVESLTYKELMEAARLISDCLEEYKIKNEIVGVYLPSHVLVPAVLLGVLQVPAIFTFLDVSAPWSWNAQFAQRCPITYIISLKEMIAKGSEEDFENIKHFSCKEADFVLWKNRKVSRKCLRSCTKPLAYCVRTSGSTGLPKVVRVPHSCILPNIQDFKNLFGISESDVILQLSSLTFDPSIIEIFMTLSSGASLLLIPAELKTMPSHLTKVCFARNRVTVIQSTPTVFRRFDLPTLRNVIFHPETSLRIFALGGEPFPPMKLINEWRAENSRTQIFNLYGVTEVSCWASARCVTSEPNLEPDLGDLLSATRFQIRDEKNQLLNKGQGVLYIGGEERVCYLDEEDLPTGTVWRNTGDMVDIRQGKVYYIGRSDDQIKRQGKRLSLSTVELCAKSLDEVQAAVAVHEQETLWLFVQRKKDFVENRVVKTLEEMLPSFARPNFIINVDQWPITSHGKVDKRALVARGKSMVLQNTPGEQDNVFSVKSLWKSFTSCDPKPSDNFVRSGGDSFCAVNFAQAVEARLGRPLPVLANLLMDKTFADVLEYVQSYGSVLNQGENHTLPKREYSDGQTKIKKPRLENSDTFTSYRLYRRGFNPTKLSSSFGENTVHVKVTIAWKYDLRKCVDASPLLVEYENRTYIYIGSHSHILAAIDLKERKAKWQTELPDRIESSATVVENDGRRRVYVGCYDGKLYGLDAESGAFERELVTGNAVKCSPVAYNSCVFCGSHDGYMYCFNDQSGKLVWRTQLAQGSIFASPVIDAVGKVLYVASLAGCCAALDCTTGDVIWQTNLDKPVFGSPAFCGQRILFPCVDGKLYCLNSYGLEEWSFVTQGQIYSSVCVTEIGDENVILFGCHDHKVYCLNEAGQLLWQHDTNAPVYATPFVFRMTSNHKRNKSTLAAVVANITGEILVLNLSDGNLLGRCKLPGEVFSSPVFCENHVIVGCRDNYTYCLNLEIVDH